MYKVKITFNIAYIATKSPTNVNLNPHEMSQSLKFAKMYMRQNIHLRSNIQIVSKKTVVGTCVLWRSNQKVD